MTESPSCCPSRPHPTPLYHLSCALLPVNDRRLKQTHFCKPGTCWMGNFGSKTPPRPGRRCLILWVSTWSGLSPALFLSQRSDARFGLNTLPTFSGSFPFALHSCSPNKPLVYPIFPSHLLSKDTVWNISFPTIHFNRAEVGKSSEWTVEQIGKHSSFQKKNERAIRKNFEILHYL